MTSSETIRAGYFDAMYRAAPDPWGFEERWYEQRKYAISLAQLPVRRYHHAFEPGCSIGVFTHMLAPRCDDLLSCDIAAGAVQAAARRTADQPQVRVEQRQIPGEWPPGRFDLIVLSEILYYFGDHDLQRILDSAVAALEPEGTLLAVHWRHHVPEYPRSGDDVHRALAAQPGLARLVRHEEPDFIAEVYIGTEGTPVSVARAAGLA
jgi:SAM-dependent methyltransferase